ncbi:MAG: glycoside hydrolase family 3 protein [Spirochaetia bacterium]
MLPELTNEQKAWVEHTLNELTVEQKVGHLLCPEDRKYSPEDWKDIIQKYNIGTAFLLKQPEEIIRKKTKIIQKSGPIPLLIAGDLEHGNQVCEDTGTIFPWSMAQAATGDPESAYKTGVATGIEGRDCGINWTYAPVTDLNYNYMNGVTMLRSYGDNPEHTRAMSEAFIKGIQQDGRIAATPKHFPGDGVDSRDQHRVTSLNTLPFRQWEETYGKVWKGVIDAGAFSIMIGHIGLPDYEIPGEDPEKALPATLSYKLQSELLRKHLGFTGLIVSDAAPMIGMTTRVTADRQAVEFILAGGDNYLFARPKEDYHLLLEAVKNGTVPEEILEDRVRHVLECKARLNLHDESKVFGTQATKEQILIHRGWAKEIAEKALTVLRKPEGGVPDLKPGDPVLTITVQRQDINDDKDPTGPFDQTLSDAGLRVEHLYNPGHPVIFKTLEAREFTAVFVNLVVVSKACIGIHHLGSNVMNFWRTFYAGRENCYFTSLGSPYMLRELPSLPNLVCTFGDDPSSQEAAAAYWLGKLEAPGKCPVKLPKARIAPLGELIYEMK